MNHPAELSVYTYLQKAMAGEVAMAEEVIDKVASDVKAAMLKQFSSGPRDDFRLRMSNIGKPKCQLWFEKNDPEGKEPFPPHFLMNMILGDIVEAVFKGLLTAADVSFKDNDKVVLKLPNGQEIKGEYDMEMDGRIDDVKSASWYSYNNKFESIEEMQKSDGFGYVSQLVGYSEGAGKDVGGWWVINKNSGEFKYVDASGVDKEKVLKDIQDTVDYIENDEPFERCFQPVPETYRKVPSGNIVLNDGCNFCQFKHKCFPNLKVLPSKVYKGKLTPPLVNYVEVNG
tara:strand:+ start:939 stop:1793 length:855 start_codon:yes stop_codon:yes gene_type:complete